MQTGSPFELSLLWCWPVDIEADLHSYFADCRTSGEWFKVDADHAIAVAAQISKLKWKEEVRECTYTNAQSYES